MKLKTTLRPLAVATTLAVSAMAVPTIASADMSANIGVYSKYILRGITNAPEQDSPAVQGGFDWSGESGLYAGYWGSTLGYADEILPATTPATYKSNGFENDFYGGYASSMGDISYDVGLIYYKYINISNADAAEIKGRLGYGPVTAGFNYLTKDVTWGNKGDTYWTLAYSTDLPKGFSLGALASYYTYKDSGKYIASTPKSGAFRDLELSLSHPIGNSGADMTMTYIAGGKDRNGVDQKNAITFGISYGFDIK